jgi:hypothetical protein
MTETKIDKVKLCANPECEQKGKLQPMANFTRHPKSPDGLKYWCKKCCNKRRQKQTQQVQKYLMQARAAISKCEKCGKIPEKIEYLQFSHNDRSKKYRSKTGKPVIRAVEKELPHGQWCCADCAVKDTYRENEQKKSNSKIAQNRAWELSFWYKYVNDEKIRRGQCSDCGRSVTPDNLRTFHFDHRDPRTKLDAIGELVTRLKPFALIRAEWNKCDLRCEDCHRDRGKRKGHFRSKKERKDPGTPFDKREKWQHMTAMLLTSQLGNMKGHREFIRLIQACPFNRCEPKQVD